MSNEDIAEEYVSKLEKELETDGPPFDQWERSQVKEHFIAAIGKAIASHRNLPSGPMKPVDTVECKDDA